MKKYALLPFRLCKIPVGLLGGSFNPPHKGHYYIAKQAMKRLSLKKVYWLVSPQNPLKSKDVKTTFFDRYKLTKSLVRGLGPKDMIVSDIEGCMGNKYTVQLLSRLREMHPKTDFVWIIGGDNLALLPKWHLWRSIMDNHHLCVLDRDQYPIKDQKIRSLYPQRGVTNTAFVKSKNPKSYSILKVKKVPISSTMIREKKANIKADT